MKIKSLLFVSLLFCSVAYAQEKKQPVPQPQQQVTIEQLYQLKGQLVTTLEFAQNQLAEVNKAISEQLNKQINK